MFTIGFCLFFLPFIVSSNVEYRKDSEKYKPRNVMVDIVNLTSVHLQWEHPKDADPQRCPVKRYTIRLKTEGATRSRTWKIDGNRQSVALHDLSTGTTYYVRLLAVACDGKGKPSRWVKVQTTPEKSNAETHMSSPTTSSQELQSPGKPTYVRTRTFPDSVIVSWLPPEDSIVIRGYMVGYGEGVPDVNWQYVEAAKQNVTIKNLKPATQYIVSIRAFNNFGKGPVVYDLIYTREPTASTVGPESAPGELNAKILSPTTAWLQWNDPSLGRQQQLLDTRYYNVHYQAIPPGGGKILSVIVKALHVVLYDLIPGTKYEFKVRMVKDSQATPFSESVFNRTFETAPSSPPRGIAVLQSNVSGSVLVSWRPPRFPNGEITGYLVLYSQNSTLATEKWQVQAVIGPATETTIANLAPNKTYHFKIQARNSNGYSPLSSSSIFYTSFAPGSSADQLTKLTNAAHEMNEEYEQNLSNTSKDIEMDSNKDIEINRTTDGASFVNPMGAVEQTTIVGNTSTTVMAVQTDDYDDYEDKEDEDDDDEGTDYITRGTTMVGEEDSSPRAYRQQSDIGGSGGEGKRKREQILNEGPSAAEKVEMEDSAGSETIQVRFRATVQHQVSAFVTWPASIGQQCTPMSITGYAFRYRREKGPVDAADEQAYVTKNMTDNFILLNDLQPKVRYRYQVKYQLENTVETPWSKEGYLST